MARDYSISDDPCSLSDLAKRWHVSKWCLWRLTQTRDIGPDHIAGGMGLYDAIGQEALAKALEGKRPWPAGGKRSAAPVRAAAGKLERRPAS